MKSGPYSYSTTSNIMASESSVEAGKEMWEAMVEAWVKKLSKLRPS